MSGRVLNVGNIDIQRSIGSLETMCLDALFHPFVPRILTKDIKSDALIQKILMRCTDEQLQALEELHSVCILVLVVVLIFCFI